MARYKCIAPFFVVIWRKFSISYGRRPTRLVLAILSLATTILMFERGWMVRFRGTIFIQCCARPRDWQYIGMMLGCAERRRSGAEVAT